MIRPLARGVLVDEDRVLLTLNRFDGDVYLFPGGEPEAGEKVQAAVTRHAREQTGYDVTAHELLWVREHVSVGRLLLDSPGGHVAEFFFRCTASGTAIADPHEGAPHQLGAEWVARDRLATLQLRPQSLATPLVTYLTDREVTPPVYALEDD